MKKIIFAALIAMSSQYAFANSKAEAIDPQFAKGIGISHRWMDILYTGLLVTTIVIGIQAVGVILIAALLIIPAVSARYWTESFKVMVLLSALFGGLSGALGTLISALGSGLPTGPFIVTAAATCFVIALIFGKERGLLIQKLDFNKQKGRYEKHAGQTAPVEKGGGMM